MARRSTNIDRRTRALLARMEADEEGNFTDEESGEEIHLEGGLNPRGDFDSNDPRTLARKYGRR